MKTERCASQWTTNRQNVCQSGDSIPIVIDHNVTVYLIVSYNFFDC